MYPTVSEEPLTQDTKVGSAFSNSSRITGLGFRGFRGFRVQGLEGLEGLERLGV